MKAADLLETRSQKWQQLDRICVQMSRPWRQRLLAEEVSQFASLYRAACADLALADAYQLPPETVQYLHQLVGRAHNQLHQSKHFETSTWGNKLFCDAPRAIFQDRSVRICFCLFWIVFLSSMFFAVSPHIWPTYCEELLGDETIENMEAMYANGLGRDPDADLFMAAFYIFNNTGIGLKCFVLMLLIVPGMYVTVYNAAVLGAVFGYMSRPDTIGRDHFLEFVTAHGPFELTAIVLAAGAGLRLGISWVDTGGMTRLESLERAGRETLPIVGAMMMLFFLAALIEGFLSPSAAPYAVKAGVAILSTLLLIVYFFVLGNLGKRRFEI